MSNLMRDYVSNKSEQGIAALDHAIPASSIPWRCARLHDPPLAEKITWAGRTIQLRARPISSATSDYNAQWLALPHPPYASANPLPIQRRREPTLRTKEWPASSL